MSILSEKSIHSRIGLLNYDGTITSIYCETPYSRNILKFCYTTRSKVMELLKKGNLQPIEYKGATRATLETSPARTDDNLSDYIKNGEYYNYLFDGEAWTVYFKIHDEDNDFGHSYGHFCRFGLMEEDIIKSVNYWVSDKPVDIFAILKNEYNTKDKVLTLMQANGIGEVYSGVFENTNVKSLTICPDSHYYIQPRIDRVYVYTKFPLPNSEYCNFLFRDNTWTYYCQDYTTI